MTRALIDKGLSSIKSGSRIFIHGCGGTPQHLNRLLAERANELRRVEIMGVLALDNTFTDPKLESSFFVNTLFASGFVRPCIANGTASYILALLSEMPRLFDENILPLDAAFIQVSPPDMHGYCSLGISIEVTRAALRNAKKVFAQINRNMPRVHGDTFVHMNQIDAYVEHDEPLIEVDYSKEISDVEKAIGKHVAELIDDRSTLQMGIGTIPDCVLKCLENHKDLSIASEMISDGVMNLIQKGVVTNRYKKFHPGITTCTFILGTRKLYDYVNDNPNIFAFDVGITNDPTQIRQNRKMCAINAAIEVDLTGQLKEGAGVTTSRAHVHYIVTEYGATNLFGKNYQQRAKALIELAHPDHREALDRAAHKRFKNLY
ncbi:unnamed protein product [Rotaria socialis]|uniref:Acetyl-CoA hydrolase n=1 Tax=Rotaria socialis TaxID=392032 RepID=A0A818VWA7_9BILA|nr:unnamed protein product [Rotaria socialis]